MRAPSAGDLVEPKPLRTEAAVLAALALRFAAPEYAFVQHVRNGTGYTRRVTRTADALAFSLWPSRGLELHGFEVKVSRADWLREKADPDKAEDIARFCDRWWIAAGDSSIVQPGELPPTWGLLVPKAGKLVVATEAPKLEAKPLDRLMLAAIFRKVTENMVPADSIRELAEERAQEIAKHMLERSREGRETKHLLDEIKSLKETIKSFEDRSGVPLNRWQAGDIGDAVRVVLSGIDAKATAIKSIESSEDWLRRALKSLSETKRRLESES